MSWATFRCRCRQWERAAAYYGKALEIYNSFDDPYWQVRIHLTLDAWLTSTTDRSRDATTCLPPFGGRWAASVR